MHLSCQKKVLQLQYFKMEALAATQHANELDFAIVMKILSQTCSILKLHQQIKCESG